MSVSVSNIVLFVIILVLVGYIFYLRTKLKVVGDDTFNHEKIQQNEQNALLNLQNDQIGQAIREIFNMKSEIVEKFINMANVQEQNLSNIGHGLERTQSSLQLTISEKMRGMEEKQNQQAQNMKSEIVEKFTNMAHDQKQDLVKIGHGLKETQSNLQLTISDKMREMEEKQNQQVQKLTATVQEKLEGAVERQMQTSFQRVIDQLQEMNKSFGEMRGLTAQVNDFKRLFSNIKTRGGWGESQCQAILDDILSPENYLTNHSIKTGTREAVEFAVKMPIKVKKGEQRPILPIDSKFPLTAYEKLIQAQEEGNLEEVKSSLKELERNIILEAKKISEKYIHEPVTVNFAVLYLPTDGLYYEVARMPDVISKIGREQKVLIMGPSLLPALLKTISLGYMTLALEGKSDEIRAKLTLTLQEVKKIDKVFDQLEKNFGVMENRFKDVRKRTSKFSSILEDFDTENAHEMGFDKSIQLEYNK